MAEPEDQEETTAVNEETREEPSETRHEESAAEAPADGPVQEEKVEGKPPATEEEKEKPAEGADQPEDQKRRPSSAKRASIDEKVIAVPVNQDTFTPPDMKRQSVSSADRRISATPGTKRSSVPLGKIPSTARKSKFGALSSKARMVLGSIVDIKTSTAEYYDKRAAKYQNTYKLDSENPFNSEKVKRILREVMEEALENLQYDPEKCASTAKFASTQIRSKVKQLEFDRYKLVCIVSIGEKNFQDVYATCRFLWDPEKDRYAFYSLENTYVYAIAYCFGLYYE